MLMLLSSQESAIVLLDIIDGNPTILSGRELLQTISNAYNPFSLLHLNITSPQPHLLFKLRENTTLLRICFPLRPKVQPVLP